MTGPTHPASPETQTPRPRPPWWEGRWWQRNRLALLLLLPLFGLAMLAASYNLVTLYRPNHFTRPQRANGSSLAYHERYSYTGFGGQKRWYTRDVSLTLESVWSASRFQGEQAARGATLWVVTLEFRAPPEVVLDGCLVTLVDANGTVYGDRSGKSGTPLGDARCVPEQAPGATFDVNGAVVIKGNPRPASWTVQRTVAVPEGAQPRRVRVAWQPPDYAEFKVK